MIVPTKPYQISSLYLQLSITAISIHNATLLSCHFRKIATVSHFRLVCFLQKYRGRNILRIQTYLSSLLSRFLRQIVKMTCIPGQTDSLPRRGQRILPWERSSIYQQGVTARHGQLVSLTAQRQDSPGMSLRQESLIRMVTWSRG